MIIPNHKKADLEKVLCDNLVCGERGDYGRCYLESSKRKNCPIYQAYLKLEKKNERQMD